MSDDRRAYLRVQIRWARKENQARREIAESVDTIIRRHVEGKAAIDPLTKAMIDRDLDTLFRVWYGIAPGDRRATWYQMIVRETQAAFADPFVRARDDVRRRLPADVVRAIEREAA